MTKYWTNAQASLRQEPRRAARKILDIPPNAVIETDEFIEDDFLRAVYGLHSGWIGRTLAEPYMETLPKDCVEIPNQTPDNKDAEQYFYLDGVRQLNFCGQLAICYSNGMKLDNFISIMKAQVPLLWKRLKGGGKFSGTTAADLIQMCTALGLNSELLAIVTKDAFANRSRYTPAVLQNLVQQIGFPIVACKIDAGSGRLRGQGTGHWHVVTAVYPERTGGRVQIYNPFPNRIEEYSYQEWIASCNQPYGVMIYKPEGVA